MIVLNFKTYSEVTLENKAIVLAQNAQAVAARHSTPIILCVQATDLYKVSQVVHLPVYAQHCDPFEPGKHTGFISAQALKANGATGVLLNHSEHRMPFEVLEPTIHAVQAEGLAVIVCVENSLEAARLDDRGLQAIALEDPALIGGTVSIVENELGRQKIEEAVRLHLKTPLLVGAGVKDQVDVAASIRLGAQGVLLASGFTLAQNPLAVLEDLCQGFLNKDE